MPTLASLTSAALVGALMFSASTPKAQTVTFEKYAVQLHPDCVRAADRIAATDGVFFSNYAYDKSSAVYRTRRNDVGIRFNCITSSVIVTIDRAHADANFIASTALLAERVGKPKAAQAVRACLKFTGNDENRAAGVSCSRAMDAIVVVFEARQ